MSNSPYGWTAPVRDSFVLSENDLQTGEIVNVLILGMDFPVTFKKDVDPSQLSFKEHGISLQLAITLRDRLQNQNNPGTPYPPVEKCFLKDDNGNPIEPKFTVFTTFNAYPPRLVASKYKIPARGGQETPIVRIDGSIVPTISELLPNAFEEKDKETGKLASDIFGEDIAKYSYLLARENKRRKDWDNIFAMWEHLDNDQCCSALMNTLSRQLLLCKYNEGTKKFEFVDPKVGMLFRSRIKRNDKTPKYFELQSNAWNSQAKRFEIYSSLDTTKEVAPEYAATAIKLLQLRDTNIAARMASKTITEAYSTPEGDKF